MQYRKLLTNKTKKEIEDMCENWYSRLNNLKAFYVDNKSHMKIEKVKSLIIEMIARMIKMTHVYAEINKPRLPKNTSFVKGGIVYDK